MGHDRLLAEYRKKQAEAAAALEEYLREYNEAKKIYSNAPEKTVDESDLWHTTRLKGSQVEALNRECAEILIRLVSNFEEDS